MKRFLFGFAVSVLICFLPTLVDSIWAEETEAAGGKKRIDRESEGANPGKEGDSGTQATDSSTTDDSSVDNSKDTTKNDDSDKKDDTGESKTFVCPKCGYTSDSAGECPACNVALSEQSGDSSSSGSSGDEAPPKEGDTGSQESGDSSGSSEN